MAWSRCADALPPPLTTALVVESWECIPPPERWLCIFFADLAYTPVSEVAEDDVAAALALAGYSVPEVRLHAFRGNYAVQTMEIMGVLYWKTNAPWMVQVADARLLGCCQIDAPKCLELTGFPPPPPPSPTA